MFDHLEDNVRVLKPAGLPTVEGAAPDAALMLLLPLIVALILSVVIIPIMVRLAPKLGMIDMPEARKVHAVPIPRIGGFGIVIGTLIPVMLLVPMGKELNAFLFGGLVLFGFGALDDWKTLGHYVKFIGQFIAVIAVVYFGDLYVSVLPFMGGEPVPEYIGRPFTVMAMVGMINAINHSDGLDGLAGGESMLSLACIAYLAYMADGLDTSMVALAIMGSLLGFMKYNTCPARIFMGDSGSQFLGFALGFLAVLLTQRDNPVLSPALPALVLGLPIADIIMVFALRIYHRMNWFRASRNHVHHRLLDLGFYHHESVVIVYSFQAILVLLAVITAYESDVLIAGLYLGIVFLLFMSLTIAERSGWRIHDADQAASLKVEASSARYKTWLKVLAFNIVYYGVALFLVAGSLLATIIPPDFTIFCAVLMIMLAVRLMVGKTVSILPLRGMLYLGIVFVVYLTNTYQPVFLSGADPFTYGFFALLVLGIGFTVRLSERETFSLTPMDFLVVLAVLMITVMTSKDIVQPGITAIALKSIILFYGVELVLTKKEETVNLLSVSLLISLLVLGSRGFLGI